MKNKKTKKLKTFRLSYGGQDLITDDMDNLTDVIKTFCEDEDEYFEMTITIERKYSERQLRTMAEWEG